MNRTRTESSRAAGKLISAIQKEWNEELGEQSAGITEQVMNLAMKTIVRSRSVTQYLGELWVARHKSVLQSISRLEHALANENA